MTFVHLQTAPEAALPYAVLIQGLRKMPKFQEGGGLVVASRVAPPRASCNTVLLHSTTGCDT